MAASMSVSPLCGRAVTEASPHGATLFGRVARPKQPKSGFLGAWETHLALGGEKTR